MFCRENEGSQKSEGKEKNVLGREDDTTVHMRIFDTSKCRRELETHKVYEREETSCLR